MRILRQVCLGLFLLLTVVSCATTRKGGEVDYPIDHGLQKGEELPPVSIQHGEKLDIEIRNTKPACYFYNARVEEDPSFVRAEIAPAGRESVHLEVVHDESVVAYLVDVSPRDDRPEGCDDDKDLGARSWKIPVRSLWNLAGAGGFVAHDLVNPEFFMTPATRPGTTEQGFIIHRQAENEDDHTIATAAMLHLWRSDTGFYGINWSPLSFGLGVDDKRTDYLVGTSLRFGNRVYITFGRIFGNVTRLKSGTVLDQFTTDANALTGLPTRRDESWFVSASFGFLNAGVSNLFKSKVGIPAVPPPTDNDGDDDGGGNGDLHVDADPVEGAAGVEITIKPPTGGTFGPSSATNAKIKLTDAAGNEKALTSKAVGAKWKPEEIKVTIPAEFTPGEVTIEVMVGDKKVATSIYTIQPPPPPEIVADPVLGGIGVDIKLAATEDIDFGDEAEESKLVLTPATGEPKPILSSELGAAGWKKKLITFKVPAGIPAGKVEIQVVVNGEVVATSKYTVQ